MDTERFPHDAAYKEFFSNPDMVGSLLRDFAPRDFAREFDFDTLELCNGAYISAELQQRQDDIVWRLRWRDTWCYVYILLEFQSSPDYWMALRIAGYTILLWQELIKTGQIKSGEKLPPVFPMVIYNGESSWRAALKLKNLIAPIHSGLAKYQPDQEYFLLDESWLDQILLEEAKGEAGYIFRFERAKDVESVMAIYQELMGRISDERFDFLRRSIQTWLAKLMRKKNIIADNEQNDPEEGNIMLEQKFRRWEQEFIQKGMLAGREEGMAQGMERGMERGIAQGLLLQKNTLLEMLAKRFGEIPAAWRDGINAVTNPDIISQLTVAILSVNSSDEFGALLRRRQDN